jgi:hypothetical protein
VPPPRLAFPALILANIFLAFGPWLVRLSDVGPVAAAFWRLALAVPVLLVLAGFVGPNRPRLGTPISPPGMLASSAPSSPTRPCSAMRPASSTPSTAS